MEMLPAEPMISVELFVTLAATSKRYKKQWRRSRFCLCACQFVQAIQDTCVPLLAIVLHAVVLSLKQQQQVQLIGCSIRATRLTNPTAQCCGAPTDRRCPIERSNGRRQKLPGVVN